LPKPNLALFDPCTYQPKACFKTTPVGAIALDVTKTHLLLLLLLLLLHDLML
jgi:hypothetical protein